MMPVSIENANTAQHLRKRHLMFRKPQSTQTFPHLHIRNPSEFLAACMERDSNLEMEWLWASAHVKQAEEKYYCLQRALNINPQNAIVRRQLEDLLQVTQRSTVTVMAYREPGMLSALSSVLSPRYGRG
jgi:hypothetical protein